MLLPLDIISIDNTLCKVVCFKLKAAFDHSVYGCASLHSALLCGDNEWDIYKLSN